MRKKISTLLIVSLVLGLMASCAKKPTSDTTNATKATSESKIETQKEEKKSKEQDPDIIKSGYDVLDYCSTDSEIFAVLDKIEKIPEPDTYGELTLPALTKITVSVAKKIEITKEDVDDEIKRRIDATKEYLIPNRKFVKNGDKVNIDFSGSIDGVEFPGGRAEGQELEIGSHTFIEGFEEQLIGKELDTTFDIHVTFPKDYSAENLAGKDATFKITINEIKEPHISAYDEKFIEKDTNGKCKTKKEYEAFIKDELEKAASLQYTEMAKMALDRKLIDLSTLEATKKALAYGFALQVVTERTIANQYGKSFQEMLEAYGFTGKQYVELAKEMELSTLKSKAIVKELAKKFNMSTELTDKDKQDWFNNIITMYGYDPNEVTYEKLVAQVGEDTIVEDILKSKVLDEAIKHVTIIPEEEIIEEKETTLPKE